ncbi:MAG: hypothetical protein HC850_08565 [Rhodomicrobium sp.]|nr:hypothetical protein [Rhodomicrobium sp.]
MFYPRSLDMQRRFKLHFIELDKETTRDLDGIRVTPIEVDHYSGSPSYALRFELDGRVFAFSGDAAWSDAVLRAGQGADLYLIECYQYDLKLPMHLDYLTIAQNFDAIGAKQFVLTHMSEAMLARLDGIDKARCKAAEDGMIIDF